MIERKNILELIGRHRGKYHSCVLTCYSLDFSFFEERVLPALRLANIKNVNVLADGHYLELAQEDTTGKEFKHNKTYNFQPVYEKGVFHPKIMLLTGVKHGLLIIGSGNITSSGLSTNDEIWGAFHLDNIGNENALLFGAVWNYLQPYLDKSRGFISQKIDWIQKYSPWLLELPITDDWISLKSLDIEMKFIGNSEKYSTFQQLKTNISINIIDEMTVVSPYFDRAGRQLKQLKDHFNPSKMRCLVDPNSGLLPSSLDDTTLSQISFYSWSDCKKDYEDTYNRLHAKLINIRTKDEEYLLLGSANTTIAGMGSGEDRAKNGEAGILLRRRVTTKSFIEELGVQIPKTTIKIKHLENRGFGEESIPRLNYKYKILYAELRADEITIHLNKECSIEFEVKVIDRNDIHIENIIKEVSGGTIVVKVNDPDNVFKLSLVDAFKLRISNYCLVHRIEALLRCNPDPNQEKLDALMEQDFSDGEGITDLLQFVDYNWADEDSNPVKKVFNNGARVIQKVDNKEQTKDFEVLKSEEFNKVSAESLLKQSGELSNSTVKIAEFLNLYAAGVFGKEDFQESEEQKLLEDEDQKGEGEEAENRSRKRSNGSKEKIALNKYFKKLDNIYTKRLEKLFSSQALTEVPQSLITIRSLSSILIALQLIHLKYGKKFTILTRDLDETEEAITKEELYINSGTFGSAVDSVKGFLLNVLGKFLLLSAAGNKEYEFEILNQKLARSQTQFLVKSVSLILNIPWRASEGIDRDVLLLNTIYFSYGEKMLNKEAAHNILNKLNEFKAKATFVIPKFQGQLDHFSNTILPSYLKWLKSYVNKKERLETLLYSTSNLRYGEIIFNRKIGFNVVKKVVPFESSFKLNLSRAGYQFKENKFTLKDVQVGNKCITYEMDEIKILNTKLQ